MIVIIKVNPGENQTYKIGRGKNNEISLNDITVSRTHAFIHYN